MERKNVLLWVVVANTALTYIIKYVFGDPLLWWWVPLHWLPEIIALFGLGVLEKIYKVPHRFVWAAYIITALGVPVALGFLRWEGFVLSAWIASPYLGGYLLFE